MFRKPLCHRLHSCFLFLLCQFFLLTRKLRFCRRLRYGVVCLFQHLRQALQLLRILPDLIGQLLQLLLQFCKRSYLRDQIILHFRQSCIGSFLCKLQFLCQSLLFLILLFCLLLLLHRLLQLLIDSICFGSFFFYVLFGRICLCPHCLLRMLSAATDRTRLSFDKGGCQFSCNACQIGCKQFSMFFHVGFICLMEHDQLGGVALINLFFLLCLLQGGFCSLSLFLKVLFQCCYTFIIRYFCCELYLLRFLFLNLIVFLLLRRHLQKDLFCLLFRLSCCLIRCPHCLLSFCLCSFCPVQFQKQFFHFFRPSGVLYSFFLLRATMLFFLICPDTCLSPAQILKPADKRQSVTKRSDLFFTGTFLISSFHCNKSFFFLCNDRFQFCQRFTGFLLQAVADLLLQTL